MKKETKNTYTLSCEFANGDKVFILAGNKVRTAKVVGVAFDIPGDKEPVNLVHIVLDDVKQSMTLEEKDCYASKEELIASL